MIKILLISISKNYSLDPTKNNSVHNFRDNVPRGHNQFEKYDIMSHNLQQSLDRDRQSQKKEEIEELIYEVGGMLSDFLPPEQVQARLNGFKRRLDVPTDYTALYTELDNLRTRLFDIALGRATWSNTH
jgi:hypothetical protein